MFRFLTLLTVFSSVVFSKGDDGYDTYRIPALIQAGSGDILAFAEARRDGISDNGQIDLVMRRSTDGGRSWGKTSVIWHEDGYTCGNPAPVVDSRTGRILLLGTRNQANDTEYAIRRGTSEDTRRVFILHSDDNGCSWSAPREITAETKHPDWGWYATGPCHGIQLQHERFAGRIVIPCDHTVIRDGACAGGGSHVIISDDGGNTWRIGGICPDGNESTVAETSEGDLLLNMRAEAGHAASGRPSGRRLLATSINGGESFSAVTSSCLREPVCMGSMTNFTNRGRNTEMLLFCNPDDESQRRNLTLKASADCGRSWHKVRTLCEGPSAYSDIAVLKDGSICALYETGEVSPYERIVFQADDCALRAEAAAAWSADKYSMFIHFGVYSMLGGVWNGHPVTYGYSEQIQSHAGIQDDMYVEAARRFNPVAFNADSIAALAKAAGMRSVVITGKHHDGYCLFGTATTDFNSVQTCGRDFIKELCEACSRAGLKFGLYYSLIDWHDPYGNRISTDNDNYIKPEHHSLNVRQVTELVSSYGPISELWFDMGHLTKEQSEELYRTVRLFQPGCMVSGRLGNDCYDFCVMSDNSYPDGTLKTAWQAPASMFNATWGYRSWQVRENPEGKAAEKLRSLLGCVSHGGNFILNIGPKGDGTVVDYEKDVLMRIGGWLRENGEAVYGTRPFAWPGVDSWGCCTASGKSIYVIPELQSASDTVLTLPVRGCRLVSATWLDSGEKVKCGSVRDGVSLHLPASDHAGMPRVVKLTFSKSPAEPGPEPILLEESGDSGCLAVLDATNATPDHSYSCTYYYDNHKSIIGYNWCIAGAKACSISVEGPAELAARRINIALDGEMIAGDVAVSECGAIDIPTPSGSGMSSRLHHISLTAADMDNPHSDIRLEGLRLVVRQ